MNEEFDAKQYESYVNNRDYDGLYTYLSSLTPKDQQSYRKVQSVLETVKRQADIQRGILEQLQYDPKARDAYHFTKAMNGEGVIPRKDPNDPNSKGNYWGDQYNDLVNGLVVTRNTNNASEGDKISAISFKFKNADEYDSFLKKSGLAEHHDADVGLIHDSKTGTYQATVSRHNLRLTSYVDAANASYKVSNAKSNLTWGDPLDVYVSNALVNDPHFLPSRRTFGVTDSGALIPANAFNYESLHKLNQLKQQANKLQEKAVGDLQSYTGEEEVVITEFLGTDHAAMRQSYQAGNLSESEYNTWVTNRKKTYDNQLRLASLAKYKVYASADDAESAIIKPVDSKTAYKLNQELLVALDQNRVAYSAAMVGGELGTYITISPAVDSHNDPKNGEYAKGRTLFIPGLFKNTCDESFKQNTKQRAVVENQQMKRFNYGTTLADGSFVGYDKRLGSYMKTIDDDGNEIKVPIDEADMLQMLNKHHILEQGYKSAAEYVLYESVPDTQIINGKKVPVSVEDKIRNVIKHGVNEVYPKGEYTNGQRLMYAQQMYNIIMMRLQNRVFKKKKTRTNTN